MTSFDLASYLSRIGYSGPGEATLATLRDLHGLHPRAIVFENIDVLLKQPIRLDPDALFAKLVSGGRGGYCYEHNTLFKSALEAIGFHVRALGAEVLWRVPPGPPRSRSHMLLAVSLPDGEYIADAGFGGLTLTAPLRLEAETEQSTPHGIYRLMPDGEEMRLEAKTRGEWSPVYRIAPREENQAHWEVFSWHTSTHPDSRFTRELIMARPAPDRRFALLNNVLNTYHLDGTSERRILESPAALETVLTDVFDLDLPQVVPILWQKLRQGD